MGTGLMVLLTLLTLVGCDGQPSGSSPDDASSADRTERGAPGAGTIAERIRSALASSDVIDRSAALSRVLQSADAEDLQAIHDAFEDPQTAPGPLDDALFLAWWSRFDQSGAYQWVMNERRSPSSLNVIFENWGRRDPRTAASILEGSGGAGIGTVPPPLRQSASVGLLRGWLESGQPGLVAYLATVVQSQGGIPAVEEFGRYLVASRGADGAIEFLGTLPEGQQSVMTRILFAMARPITRASPEAGRRLVERHRDDPAASNLLIGVAEGWVDARGGEAAMEWVLDQRDHPRLRATVSSVFRRWARLDREAAMAWMEPRLEQVPPELEGALVVYIGFESEDDMLRALELRKQIRAGLVRRDVTLKLLRDWRRKDPDAANAWIDQSTTLSAYVRKQLDRERDKPQLGLQGERTTTPAEDDGFDR